MNRTSVSFKRMAWLALVATVLAALMPTASRFFATTADHAAPVLHEMCTAAGIKLFDASPAPAGGHDDPAAPMTHAMDDACGYCVLATSLLLLLVLLAAWALMPQATLPLLHRSARLKPNRNVRGLGSQAPPLAL